MLRRSPPLRLTLVLLFGGVAAYVLCFVARVDLRWADAWLYTALELVATALVWLRVLAEPRDRAAWVALALFATLWTAGDLGWTLDFDDDPAPPFPNWTDAVYVASYFAAYVGLVRLLGARIGTIRPSQWLDGLIGGCLLATVCILLFVGPVVDSATGSTSAVAVTLAYPTLDVLMLCVVGVAFGAGHWRPGAMWTALGLAMAISAIGDAAYTWQEATGSYSASAWSNATWPAAMALLALAAALPPARRLTARDGDGGFAVPALCALVALVVLVWDEYHDVPIAGIFAAAATLVVAGIRATLTARENRSLLRASRREALEDGLTRLPNRRLLLLDLERALDAGTGGPSTLVFFDLDGFKTYNDSFGHGAGDALLVRLATALAASVQGVGTAYRLGGDEFCVLFDRTVAREDPAVAATVAALSEDGEGFAITTSFGLVSLPAEARTASAALQLADERMYGDKGTRRGNPSRQGRDLLLQILREREPGLEEHVDDVGALALAVGRELGLDVEALDEIARAAELHDIGKIAVPEQILHKPGPLDDEEWEVMRQHTIVGERILAAAPALRPVGRLVRASHESWDGTGYPDRLVGEEIPLGARIIAVCDAFDAMRQVRPYAASMPAADALAELRRCAGTQFDPAVVEAFAAVLAHGAADALRVA